MPISQASDPNAIPTARLGALLRNAREGAGVSVAEIAERLGRPEPDVVAWERGRRRPNPKALEAFAGALDLSVAEVVPPRVPVAATVGSAQEQVAAFVRLVTTLRSAKPGAPFRFRTADLEQLALALGSDLVDVEARIAQLTSCTRTEAAVLKRQLLSRRLLIPLATGALAVVALIGGASSASAEETPDSTGTGAPVASPTTTAAPTASPTTTAAAPVDWEAKYIESQDELAAVTRQATQQQADLDAAQAVIAGLRNDLNTATQTNAAPLRQLTTQLTAANEKVAALTQTVDNRDATIADLQTRNNALYAAYDKLKTETNSTIEQLKKTNTEAHAKITALDETSAALTTKLNAALANASSANTALTGAAKSNADREGDDQGVEHRVASTRRAIASVDSRLLSIAGKATAVEDATAGHDTES